MDVKEHFNFKCFIGCEGQNASSDNVYKQQEDKNTYLPVMWSGICLGGVPFVSDYSAVINGHNNTINHV